MAFCSLFELLHLLIALLVDSTFSSPFLLDSASGHWLVPFKYANPTNAHILAFLQASSLSLDLDSEA